MAGFGFDDSPGFGFNFDQTRGGGGGFSTPRPRAAHREPLPAPEAESYGKQLVNHGLSGLHYVLSALDKPGRAVRGVLGGKAGEALAAVPFSDSIGLTNPDNAVSGKDLVRKVTGRNDNGWLTWGAGLATEMATDPLTLASFGTAGALTKAGSVAAKAGKLGALSRAERIKQGYSGLVGIGAPFHDPKYILGTGKFSQKFAGGVDKVADKAVLGNPVGRMFARGFQHKYNDALDPITMRAEARYGQPAEDALESRLRGQHRGAAASIHDLIAKGHPERDVLSAIREAAEGVPMGHVHPDIRAAVQPIGQDLHGIGANWLQEAQDKGLNLANSNDTYSRYFPRSPVSVDQMGTQIRGDTKFGTMSGANRHRDELLRGIPGGTEQINRWVAQHAGTTNDISPQLIGDMLGTARAAGKPIAAEDIPTWMTKSEELGKWISGLSQDYLATQHGPFKEGLTKEGFGGFFSPDIAGDLLRRGQKHTKTMRSATTAMGLLKDNAGKVGRIGKDAVPLPQVLKSLKMKTYYGNPKQSVPHTGAAIEALKQFGIDGSMMGRKKLRRVLGSYGLKPADMEAITRQYPLWKAPLTVGAPMKVADTANSLFKNLAYSIWPASHMRNAGSALTNNLIEGHGIKPHVDAFKVMRDTATAAELAAAHPGLPAGLSDEAARDWVKAQAYQHGKVFSGHNEATDLSGVAANVKRGGQITADVAGRGRTGPTGSFLGDVGNLLKEAVVGGAQAGDGQVTSALKPLAQAGVAGQTKDLWAPLHAGRTAGTNIEDYFRLAQYLGGVRKGMTPETAGKAVGKTHFDYGQLAPFEKNVMKRLVPFYTFQRKNLPLQVERMAKRPASISAQLRPTMQSDPNQYTPDYLANGISIPVGDEQDGQQRYISQLGLPVEEALERLKFKDGLPDVKGTAMSYMGGLNPLIKGPLESLFDTQFHTGRKLSDLHPSAVGQTLGNPMGYLGDDSANFATQAIANTPLTRMVSTVDKLIDERKGIIPKAFNLLSGVRISDVDMNKSRAIEQRKALEEMLRGSPNISSYTNFFPKADKKADLTPEEIEQLRMLSLLQSNARAYMKKRQAGEAGR